VRLLVLTTETLHHAYLVRELAARHPQVHVICETDGVVPAFDTNHPFENQRDQYECEQWFGGRTAALKDFAETSCYASVNQAEAVARISTLRADAAVVFGTRKLLPPAIEAAGANLMNVHGGDPEAYRGLDSHLWAIYHDDYANLVTTLHAVNPILDDGALISRCRIPLSRDMKLYELRRRNTECALRITIDALEQIEESGKVDLHAQKRVGRYYSFMPAVLKSVCVVKFERFCASLA